MTKRLDLVNQRFGRLVVIADAGTDKQGKALFKCRCDCGNEIIVRGYSLRNGDCKSCGCLRSEASSERLTVHGHGNEKLYRIWLGMKDRCYNSKNPSYERYGGRGIKVCDEWLNNYEAFRDFMLSQGYDEYAPSYENTIDRIDNNGNYEPSNCHVTTMKVQSLNKSNNHIITYKGKQTTVTEAAEDNGLTNHQVFNRLDKGWTMKRALTQPLTQTCTYTASGQTKTIAEWAQFMGTTDAVIRGRLRTYTMQQIYDNWIGNDKDIDVKDFSVKYETANGATMNRREWSKKLGVNETTLRKLLKEQTMQEIYDDWKSNNGRPSSLRRGALEANGIKLTQKEWCEKLKVSPKAMRRYLEKHTMQEIYDDIVNKVGKIRKESNPPKYHEANGEMHSQSEWARILDIPPTTLAQRLKTKTMQEIYDECEHKI